MAAKSGISVILFALLISSSTFGIDLSKGIMYDYPQEELEKKYGPLPVSELTRQDSIDIASYRFTGDTLKILAILIDWDDRPATYSAETMDSLMFSDHIFPGGSVADYVNEVSFGNVTVVGDVYGWHTDGNTWDFSGFESILYDLDPFVDFSQYDSDNDGVVDAVVFIRSGVGLEFSDACEFNDPADIWSHAYIYPMGSGPGPFDGKMVSRWNTSPELYPTRYDFWPTNCDGGAQLSGIRVYCHELMHNLGLPDLYDYDDKLVMSTYTTPGDYNDHPLTDWCVMGYGGYGIFSLGGEGNNPSHPCGWSKYELGWLNPVVLEQGEFFDVVLYDIETHQDSSLYILPINWADGEYFYLEYRNPHSTAQYDKLDADYSCYFYPDLTYGSDSLDQGLIITHIHDSVGSWNNNGTPSWAHYKVVVEDAGYNPSFDHTMNPEGGVTDSAQWWYPYETRLGAAWSNDVSGQSEFSPTSTPNSDGYYGASGIIVRVDSIVGDKLYAYVYSPNGVDSDGDGVPDDSDNCVDIPNPDQANNDGDSYGNLCDNCPDDINDDQTDTDSDSFGDACDVCPDDPLNDDDNDGHCYASDNCPTVYNPDQLDNDLDGIGNACCCVLRGDYNSDGSVDITDLTDQVDYLFSFAPAPPCPQHGDVNGDGNYDITDLTFFVDYLFGGGPAPVPCPVF